MTTDGRPYLGPDTTYSQQRKDRMQDAVDDYLRDDEVTAQFAYEEIYLVSRCN